MPEEIAIIVVVAIISGAVTSIVKHVTSLKSNRPQGSGESAGSSLTTSELKRMVMEAVRDGNEDLAMRLEAIEALLHQDKRDDTPPWLAERSAFVVDADLKAEDTDEVAREHARR